MALLCQRERRQRVDLTKVALVFIVVIRTPFASKSIRLGSLSFKFKNLRLHSKNVTESTIR